MSNVEENSGLCNPLDRPLAWTIFSDQATRTKGDWEHSLRDLAKFIQEQDAPVKESLPWLKLARFGDKKTGKGSLRNNRNVLIIDGIEADYDAEHLTPEQARDLLQAADIAALIYTSPSHRDHRARWRVLCPLSETQRPDKRAALVARLNGALGGILAAESFTLSQAYYYGSVGKNPAHRVLEVQGRYIDLATGLDAGAVYPEKKASDTKANTGNIPPCANVSEYAVKVLEEARALFEEPQGDRHQRILVATAMCARFVKGGHIDRDTVIVGISESCEKSGRKPNDNEVGSALDGALKIADPYVAAEDTFTGEARPEGSASGSADNDHAQYSITQAATSDDALALRFTQRYGTKLRFVKEWEVWLEWDGTRWAIDKTNNVTNLARDLCRAVTRRLDTADSRLTSAEKKSLLSAKKFDSVLKTASADPRHALTTENWDTDPWFLNTPGGIVDLRTGKLWGHDARLLMTKITAVAPGGECPIFLRFLDRITNGDKGLQDWLQRLFGYCLTGATTEHIFPFGWGCGRNGKSVLIDTVAGIMAEYAVSAPSGTFTMNNNEGHPTEIARFRGARLVTGSETEEGKRWNVTRIKEFTGASINTKIAARMMRQDFFEFVPQCKLFLIGNNKPRLGKVDQAIGDRLRLVPFIVYIPPEERDKDLAVKLKTEWSGILAWMIAGCLEWQKRGLEPPKVVADASDAYRGFITKRRGDGIKFLGIQLKAERAGLIREVDQHVGGEGCPI